ncbi:MAG: organomercurial lyase [Planctomycetota bacterium]|nr:organomercurial lyase [Planctomycetota bacterium]
MNTVARVENVCATRCARLVAGVLVVMIAWLAGCGAPTKTDAPPAPKAGGTAQPASGKKPKLLDLGAGKCIPCKLMAPILEELKKDYRDTLEVEFVDVWVTPDAAKPYGIDTIPTQIFFGPDGKELFRHVGFFSKEDILAKWKELGFKVEPVGGAAAAPAFERLEPAKADDRPKDTVCYMCDGDIIAKTLVVVKTEKGEVRLCSPHCYFIMYSCLMEDKAGFEKKVSVTDYATGKLIPTTDAAYLLGLTAKTGRPWIRAFADTAAAEKERETAGGNVLTLAALQGKELANRCGFCDRACYPEDSAKVTCDGMQTLGCCSHCALGVAVRTGKDIEVHQPDGLTGEMIVVKTLNGSVASLEPPTAVAWFGQRQNKEGKWVSAGCFHQGFFVNAENLKKWVAQHPNDTGRQISIAQALADKMKLTPQQVQKACKIGECAPK